MIQDLLQQEREEFNKQFDYLEDADVPKGGASYGYRSLTSTMEQLQEFLQAHDHRIISTLKGKIEDALGDIKYKSRMEVLPDNGEDNGTPEKVVNYEDVRIVFDKILKLLEAIN